LSFGRYKQQAIVIRKGQTDGANDARMTGQRLYVRPVTLSPAGPAPIKRSPLREPPRNHRMIARGDVTTNGIYSPSIPAFRRGELSQLATTSQLVDGLRGSFDNEVCVE
jgi:hypothetical protein